MKTTLESTLESIDMVNQLPIRQIEKEILTYLLINHTPHFILSDLYIRFNMYKFYELRNSIIVLKNGKFLFDDLLVNKTTIKNIFDKITYFSEDEYIDVIKYDDILYGDMKQDKIQFYCQLPARFTFSEFVTKYTDNMNKHPKTGEKFLRELKELNLVSKNGNYYYKKLK